MKTAMVVGAGVVGACTAHFLASQGWRVIVLERRGLPAIETSFANGGQLSVCHSTPWSSPSAPMKVLRWAFDSKSPLCFRPRMDPHQWRWLLQFMINCMPSRMRSNRENIMKLALYSRAAYQEIFEIPNIKQALVHNIALRRWGILHIYRTQRELSEGLEDMRAMNELGLDRRQVSIDEIIRMEPALDSMRGVLLSGIYTPSDMSGDAKRFVDEMVKVSELMKSPTGNRMIEYFYFTEAERLYVRNGKVGVQLRRKHDGNQYRECYEPDALILCSATDTNRLLKPIGLKTMIYPAKGYSATFRLDESAQNVAPTVSITDDEEKIVYSRLQSDILRVAGTAELSGYDGETLRFNRCLNLTEATQRLFPKLDLSTCAYWTGLRPLTPSNRPYICKAPGTSNLWLNTGHGSLGWTLAAGSAKLLSQLVENEQLENVPVPNTDLELNLSPFDYKTPR